MENGVCNQPAPSSISQQSASPYNIILSATEKSGASYTLCVTCNGKTYSLWSVTTNPYDCSSDLVQPKPDQEKEVLYEKGGSKTYQHSEFFENQGGAFCSY